MLRFPSNPRNTGSVGRWRLWTVWKLWDEEKEEMIKLSAKTQTRSWPMRCIAYFPMRRDLDFVKNELNIAHGAFSFNWFSQAISLDTSRLELTSQRRVNHTRGCSLGLFSSCSDPRGVCTNQHGPGLPFRGWRPGVLLLFCNRDHTKPYRAGPNYQVNTETCFCLEYGSKSGILRLNQINCNVANGNLKTNAKQEQTNTKKVGKSKDRHSHFIKAIFCVKCSKAQWAAAVNN